ncbi:transporter [Desulfobotulus mexicanus]|uniref:Transporter n=1 Tax=Desulfobotulus mexicanus TaxID=2586642 RepID=A0A5S5MDV0_9BACT|nr:transporter [Desulfobotulus mexicanus]TYT73877.1 transporter [Desulfobotulus mexicanus]
MNKSSFFATRHLPFLLLLTLSLCLPAASMAGGDARGYIAAPDGTTGILVYSRHRTGNEVYQKGKKLTSDANFDLNLQIIRPVYYKEIAGITTSAQALFPFGNLQIGDDSASGLFDPTFILGVWPVNNREKQLWIAVAQWIKAPFGDYDANRNINLGDNRWAFKTEASITKGFGPLYFDLVPSIEFYTDNSNDRGQKRAQDPLFLLASHVSYDLTSSFMMALSHYYRKGGEIERDGIKQDNEIETHAMQLTLGFRLAPKHQLLTQYRRDLEVENGLLTHQFGLRYFYVF